jgi:internalin A
MSGFVPLREDKRLILRDNDQKVSIRSNGLGGLAELGVASSVLPCYTWNSGAITLFARGLSPLDGLTIARERIAREAEERTGFLDLGRLGLSSLPDELLALKHLRGLNLGRAYYDEKHARGLSPHPVWHRSASSLADNSVAAHLGRLADLPELEVLGLCETDLSDLGPLRHLPNLHTLDCSCTEVSDLGPLQHVPNLHSLFCWQTQVSDLGPLRHVPNLRTLFCWQTQVSDLGPLQHVPNLHMLQCSSNQVSDLGPLHHVPNLHWLACLETQVSDLGPLQHVPNLHTLICDCTQVSDLGPLRHLPNLHTLYCSRTQVSDLGPLQHVPNLHTLYCSQCRLISPPEALWLKPSLRHLILYETQIPGVPDEVLSQDEEANCLDSLRAHLEDLKTGRDAAADIKLMILGNGRVGKTQICRRLRGENYDDTVESTHGILVTSAPLPARGDHGARLQIWDFGGQDIYHGTHALFTRSRAIYPLVWIPQAESTEEYHHSGTVFRNRPLAYWLDYVRHFGGTESPILIIQTRCDRPEDEQFHPPVSEEALRPFSFRKFLHYSARLDRGRAALDETLREAADWLRERQGIAEIGRGRAQVKRRLEQMRDEDAARSLPERKYRMISHDYFLRLCGEAGGIALPEHLLGYLNNAGTVFYRPGLFNDQIILDQSWALEAIYAVFHRDRCVKNLRRLKGRFTRSDLGEWVWDEAGHSATEQELFISMMESCGICFVHRRAEPGKAIETEYIAPEFLPERRDTELAQKWDADATIEAAVFEYALLPPGLMRGIISRIGNDAGLAADYWRGGIFAFEKGTGSRALIEEEKTTGWHGRIRVRTQRGQAALLLDRVVKLVEAEQSRLGLVPASQSGTLTRMAGILDPSQIRESSEAPALKFVQEPTSQPEYFISYAWGDKTSEGRAREDIVTHLCAAAEQRGITVLRDNKVLGLGDRLSKYMQRLGRGDRVFVVLSDKYLKSPYCMYELFEVWRNVRQDDEELLKRIRVYTLPDAKIWTPLERLHCAAHWKNETSELEGFLREHGFDLLGDKDHQR